jgi:hypothetical protein
MFTYKPARASAIQLNMWLGGTRLLHALVAGRKVEGSMRDEEGDELSHIMQLHTSEWWSWSSGSELVTGAGCATSAVMPAKHVSSMLLQ